MTYWVKSLVPMLKKSTSRASWSATATAEGTSIMMPTSIFSSKGTPAARNSACAAASMARAARTSAGVPIIGSISLTQRGPSSGAEARRMARSWGMNTSGRARQKRMARQPRNGLASSPRSR